MVRTPEALHSGQSAALHACQDRDTNEAWAFFENWKTATSGKRTATGCNPQTLPEALRTAAELAEQKQLLEQKAHQLNQQLVAAALKSILPTGYQ